MELLSYLEASEHFVRDGQFDHRGGRYHGRGWLRWDPEVGARIDLAVERAGPPLPAAIGFGFQGWLRPEDYTTIRMRIEGLDWVLAPHVGLVDRMDVLLQSHLSVDVTRLLWRQELPKSYPGVGGRVALALHPKAELFTRLEETTVVGAREYSKRSAFDGIAADWDGVEIVGRLDDRHRLDVSWADRESTLARNRAWSFAHALRAAISLCTGCGARMLERQLRRDNRRYCELLPYQKPSRLGAVSWFENFNTPKADECLCLARRLLDDESLLMTSWGAFSQLLASQEQRAWGISELLVATVLEGLLRSLEKRPFQPGQRYDVSKSLLRLRRTHYPLVEEVECHSAIEAYRRLRHRNAHPDWLTESQRLSHEELTQSSADKSTLSHLYGRILFQVAGMPDTASRIPASS